MSITKIYIDQFQIEAVIDYIDTLSCALYHSHVPVIRRILIKNKGETKTPPLQLSVSIRGFSHPWQTKIDPITPGKEFDPGIVDIILDYFRLEGISNRTKANLVIKINETIIYENSMGILGFYEWPTIPERSHQKTLACFVQPANPAVQAIIKLSEMLLMKEFGFVSFKDLLDSDVSDKNKHAFRLIYETISQKYNIAYDHEPSWSYEEESQSIRPPHQVILTHPFEPGSTGYGKGTCIDLSLLFAACLEHIGIKPLIIVIHQNVHTFHALCGFRNTEINKSLDLFPNSSQLIKDIEEKRVMVVETTGLTTQKKRTFDEALIMPDYNVKLQEQLFFALDIAVARENRLYPIQFSWSPALAHVIDEAERIALEGKGSFLDAKHLFFSFWLSDIQANRQLKQAFELARINVNEKKRIIRDMVIRAPAGFKLKRPDLFKKTENYLRIVEDMNVIARLEGPCPIDRTHLVVSLFRSNDADIIRILETLNINIENALSAFEKVFPWYERTRHVHFVSDIASAERVEALGMENVIDIESIGFDLQVPRHKEIGQIDIAHKSLIHAGDSKSSVRDRIREGLILFAHYDYARAIGIFDHILKNENGNVTALNGKGYCLLETGEINDAIQVFNRVLVECPSDIYAFAGCFISNLKLGNEGEAKHFLDKALSLHPRIPALWFHRALFCYQAGEKDQALEALYLSADLFIGQGETEEAIAVIEKSLELYPENFRLLQLRGWLERLNGSKEKHLLKSRKHLEAIYNDNIATDPETAGLLAGTYKRLWLLDPIKYPDLLEKAFEIYHETWLRSGQKNTYVGINAATLALFLDRAHESRDITDIILQFYRNHDLLNLPEVGPNFSSYWYRATQAEAELITGNLGKARRLYSGIMSLHKKNKTYISSSLDQINMILPKAGITKNAGEFVHDNLPWPTGIRLTAGIISLNSSVEPFKLALRLKDVLAFINKLLPLHTTWEILTGLNNAAERTASRILLDEKNGALLYFVLSSSLDEFLASADDRDDVHNFLNRTEEIVSLPNNSEEESSRSGTNDYIIKNCHLPIIISNKSDKGLDALLKIISESKKPVIIIQSDNEYETDSRNLEGLMNLDLLKGDYRMYIPKPVDTSHIRLSDDLIDLQEFLSENNHEIWAEERMRQGWKYGPERDDSKKKHPDLVEYCELPEEEKEYDRKTAMETLKLIRALGYKIIREDNE